MAATILITGATGLIGFRILLLALEAGHKVRYTVRSEEKAKIVATNPAVQELAPGDRLSSVIIPDFTIDGAFDHAVQGVTHIIHAGSPTPVPTFEPTTQVFQPTIKISSGLLQSALKSPSVQRIVITSSIVANLALVPGPTKVSASTRVPLPSPVPDTFDNVFEAYVIGKVLELHNSDNFIKTQNPQFTISHVIPGYVFGRNELIHNTAMMHDQNSSNNFLILGMLGAELPFPIHGGFAHVDDVAHTHLRVTLEQGLGCKDFGIATKVEYASIFDYIEKHSPRLLKQVCSRGGQCPRCLWSTIRATWRLCWAAS